MPRDEEATSSAIAFAMAGILFIAAISTVLVYANDRIPPPTKAQPHDESAAEARVLLQTLVLGAGSDVWDATNRTWLEVPGRIPGLRCSACPSGVVLEWNRIKTLNESRQGTVGTHNYTELRQDLGMTGHGRSFNLTITNSATGAILLQYGPALPKVPTRPAVAYVETDTGLPVRVVVHAFAQCTQGACLTATGSP